VLLSIVLVIQRGSKSNLECIASKCPSFGVFKAVVAVAVLWLGTWQATCASAQLAPAQNVGKADFTDNIIGTKRWLLRKRLEDQITWYAWQHMLDAGNLNAQQLSH